MNASHFSEDVLDLLELLAKHRVRYVIVGGEAVIYYGYARLTGDVVVFYGTSKENVTRLHDALHDFWSGDIPGVRGKEELQEDGIILHFGVPPNRIDLINATDGVSFAEAWQGRETVSVDRGEKIFPVNFIGLSELIKNKRALGRHKDLDDLDYLAKAWELRKRGR